MPSPARKVLSVSELNRRTRQLLETHLQMVWVNGEISNLTRHPSGHWYFSLKDDKATVRCAMFRNANRALRWQPENGMKVILRASVSLYEARGDFQLVAEFMEKDGIGQLQANFEALKAKLLAEGLFDPKQKKPLPKFPRHIGVITSSTGAALRDILTVLRRRMPAVPVTLLPVTVQGQNAAGEIAAAIARANQHTDCDVLIIGRGGGSLEDLWAFNEESVARAVFASRIPTVSAVGHEIDFSICDFVADVRAATPSAAAEIVVPDRLVLLARLHRESRAMLRAMCESVNVKRTRLQHAARQLRHPGQHLREQVQHLDHLDIRLRQALRHRLTKLHHRHQQLNTALSYHKPDEHLDNLRKRLALATLRVETFPDNIMNRLHYRLQLAAKLLDAVSPLNTLQRGYAIVTTTDKQVITQADQIKPGDTLTTRLARASFESTVITVHPDPSRHEN